MTDTDCRRRIEVSEDGDGGRDAEGVHREVLSVSFDMPATGVLAASVRGEIVLSTASELDDAVADRLSRREPRQLVLDLLGVRFIDVAGIAVLTRTRRRAIASGIRMSLVAVPTAVERTLRFFDALPLFDCHPGMADALAAGPSAAALRRPTREPVGPAR